MYLVSHDFNASSSSLASDSGSDCGWSASRKLSNHQSAEKIFMRRLEELTTATNAAYQDYQKAREERVRVERSRHTGTEELHKALDGLFRVSHRT
ncbi:hypothetical protein AAVH_06072 [Aphelenchoides avenae]|nr:hypothetical protein AAVH_06072 [Aphelenchus avenae]